jgi:hypothetical protein
MLGYAHDRSAETRALMERWLLARRFLRIMGRAVWVNRRWLCGFRVNGCEALPEHVHGEPIPCPQDVTLPCLAVATEALSSCGHKPANTGVGSPWSSSAAPCGPCPAASAVAPGPGAWGRRARPRTGNQPAPLATAQAEGSAGGIPAPRITPSGSGPGQARLWRGATPPCGRGWGGAAASR